SPPSSRPPASSRRPATGLKQALVVLLLLWWLKHDRCPRGGRRRVEAFDPPVGFAGVGGGENRPLQTSGVETNRSMPSRCVKNRAASCPLMVVPAASSGGAKLPSPPLPGETVTMPPPMPLLPGRPMSYSQSPEVSYSPAVVITARA